MVQPELNQRGRLDCAIATRTRVELSVPMTLACLSLSMLLSSLSTSIANVALPTLASALDASFQEVQWIVLAYLLAITTLVVSVGRLGDLIGRRRLLLAGLFLFVIASGVSGVSPALWLLVPARFVQGAGAAIMMALTMAFVGETVSKERTGSAMGLLGGMSAIGTALGPSLGGLLLSNFGWQSIFLINVPLGAAAFLLACRYLPPDRLVSRLDAVRFDNRGTVLLALALGSYALAMTLGRGNFGVLNGCFLLAAVSAAGLFVRAERRAPRPLVPVEVFRNPVLSAAFGMSALVSTVMMATLVVGPFYLSQALGLDAPSIGVAMSVGPIVAALSSVPAGRVADRFGAERMTTAGLAGMGFGSLMLFVIPVTFGVTGYIGALVVMTAGYGLFQTANNTSVMRDIDQGQRGVVSGVLNLSRNLGLVTGASVMGGIFAFVSGFVDVGVAPPDAVAFGMHITFAVAAGLICLALAFAAGARVLVGRSPTPERSFS